MFLPLLSHIDNSLASLARAAASPFHSSTGAYASAGSQFDEEREGDPSEAGTGDRVLVARIWEGSDDGERKDGDIVGDSCVGEGSMFSVPGVGFGEGLGFGTAEDLIDATIEEGDRVLFVGQKHTPVEGFGESVRAPPRNTVKVTKSSSCGM
jgi:hypothetical protein